MNYRHAFHAGNFADVVKHAVLVRILAYLARKPAPFRVLDTHAGAGLYDLGGEEAGRTGEWRGGVGRLSAIDSQSNAGLLLAPYRALLADAERGGVYPGSPLLARALLREGDRAVFCETQDTARDALARALGRDRRTKVLSLDGWTALGAFLPPPERRGLVLIDPPFEAPDEFERLADGFLAASRKWRTGVFVLWYPVKSFERRDAFLSRLREADPPPLLRIEVGIAPVSPDRPLTRAGLLVANAPFVLGDEVRTVLPALADIMGQDGPGTWDVAPL